MKKLFLPAFTVGVLAALWCAAPAWAGVPLKGIGVSLGKVPGGGLAQRTTDASGQADFGVLPVLPSGVVYEITIGAVPEKAQVEVAGAKDGVAMQKNIEHAVGQRAAATTIRLDADGKTPLVVTVTAESARPQPAAAGKPKSN